jgi:hypothetical protein
MLRLVVKSFLQLHVVTGLKMQCKILLIGFNNLTLKHKYVSSIFLYFLPGNGSSKTGVIRLHSTAGAADG